MHVERGRQRPWRQGISPLENTSAPASHPWKISSGTLISFDSQLTYGIRYPSPCLPPCLPSPQVSVALPGGGGVPGAFKKTANNGLALWLVLQAGHMVPSDQGAMALAMVKDILGV